MITLILNGSTNVPVTGYSRHATVDDGKIISYGSISLSDTSGYDILLQMVPVEITSIELVKDGTSKYLVNGLHGHITSINENMYDDGTLAINAQISFSNESNDETLH